MNRIRTFVRLAGAVGMIGVAATACSSSSSGNGGNLQSACNITGHYKVHSELATRGGGSCVDLPDSTVDFTPKDAGASDAGGSAQCVNQDLAACSAIFDCTTKAGGITSTTKGTIKFATDGSSGTGTISLKTVTDADGTVVADCTYTITYTKQ